MSRSKRCRFCANPVMRLDYKEPKILQMFVTDKGKIVPRRMSGICAKHQRFLNTEVRRARILALLPFAAS
ncbi:MAG: 30S ribosomal protein S18 [Deltaproteobacteria bacterium]|nr:30S ribosomal protein S18 [Deltaproteobacteria bacterium]